MDSDFELSDSDFSDEELYAFLQWKKRPYQVRQRIEYFDTLDDVDFHSRFRLSKETTLFVLSLIRTQIESPSNRNHAISPMTKLLLTLRFYGLGSMLIAVGDFCGVSKASASITVKQVSEAIASLAPTFIDMGSGEEEISEAQRAFYRKARMPRVIGAIDCTHMKIQSPGGPHAEKFRNRKGYFSLNVQVIASADLKILDLVARWPGSTDNQTIFTKSWMKQRLAAKEFGNSLIVADSGYANTSYMVTPLLHTTTRAEELYNESLVRTRNPVECLVRAWKQRFPVLSLGLRLKLSTSKAVIIATGVLHNLAMERNDNVPPLDPSLGEVTEDPSDNVGSGSQPQEDSINDARNHLIEYFANL